MHRLEAENIAKCLLQAKALRTTPDDPAEATDPPKADQERHSQPATVQHAAEAVWSSMVHKVIQQEARSVKFDEVWPHILDSLIRKGLSGVY